MDKIRAVFPNTFEILSIAAEPLSREFAEISSTMRASSTGF
jgi:hypothetical protein